MSGSTAPGLKSVTKKVTSGIQTKQEQHFLVKMTEVLVLGLFQWIINKWMDLVLGLTVSSRLHVSCLWAFLML